MATPVWACGWECGDAAGLVHFGGANTPTISTTTVRTGGLRSGRCNPSAQTGKYFLLTTGTNAGIAAQVNVHRFYVFFATLPNADAVLATLFSGSANQGAVAFKSSDSKIYAGKFVSSVFSFGASGVAVTTGVWYRIDYYVDSDQNPWTVDVQVDGSACGQVTVAVAATTMAELDVGIQAITGTISGDAFFDDYLVSNTPADYPLGAGHVESFVPKADGTHTATTTTIVKGTVASPTGGGNVAGATDVFNWVNARPIGGGATDATRLVNQQTNGTTLYAEVDFEAATAAPRAVEVLTLDRQASTATGDFTTKLVDNGVENTIIARGVVAGSTSDRGARKHYATQPNGGAAWTLARFNALKARFGYASDANPDQYWRGIMIEAEFADAPAAFMPHQPFIVNQAVNRASTY